MDAHSIRFRKLVAAERAKVEAATPPSAHATTALLLRPLTVCVRKRPISEAELASRYWDVCTVPRTHGKHAGTALILHEPKLKYDLQTVVNNHSFHFDRVYSEVSALHGIFHANLPLDVQIIVVVAEFEE